MGKGSIHVQIGLSVLSVPELDLAWRQVLRRYCHLEVEYFLLFKVELRWRIQHQKLIMVMLVGNRGYSTDHGLDRLIRLVKHVFLQNVLVQLLEGNSVALFSAFFCFG